MQKIKSIKELPKEFRLDNYVDALHLDSNGWYINLITRKEMSKCYISLGIPSDTIHYYINNTSQDKKNESISKILNSPIIKPKENNPEKEYRIYEDDEDDPVSSLTSYDAYRFFLDLSKKEQKIIKKRFDSFHSDELDEKKFDDLAKMLYDPIHNKRIAFNNQRKRFINRFGDEQYSNIGYACVNLEESDDVIFEAFKLWLKLTRKNTFEMPRKKIFTRSNFLSWHENSVLPYLDLTIWSEFNEVSIPQHIMGEAIFPPNKGINVAEAVRKTTMPLCEMLMTTGTSILNSQRYSELYSYKSE